VAVCRSCGTANADGAKFCNECAAPLAAQAAPTEQRKVVTVLFADVTGSTQLGEQLDPESLRRVLARYFETASKAIERHGGTVEKFIGDAVMAVFGVPKVHEDDALRAVRAAADLRADLDVLNVEIQRDYGTSLQIRVGVNTGEVVTGTAERLATGDTVNVAARLEQLAEPEEILLGEPTWQLLGGAADVKELPPATLKGKSAPLRVFRLLSVAPAAARALNSPMVGRTQQLQLLQNSFAVACRDRACSLFTVLGSAGVGKSRLVAEFLQHVDATAVGGRCLSYGEGITYWPLVEILTQLRSGPSAGAVADTISQDAAIASAVSAVLEEGAGATSSTEIAWGVRRLLERVAEERPLVVVVDDLHWAQPTLLDLLDHVVDLSRDYPVLVLVMARPELLEVRPGWGGGKLNATTVLLEPLDADETGRLLEELAPDLDDAQRERVRTASGGNPLFVEALVPLMAAAPHGQVAIPPTIQALVAARLDQLDDRQRRVLECGAVEGQTFHRGTVASLLTEEGDLAAQLASLVRKDLLRPDRAAVPGEEAFRFRHLMVRDAAYEGLSKARRAELHRSFAHWLEQATGLPELDELVGYHLEQSYRYREQLGPVDDTGREVAEQAATRLEAAGRQCLLRSDSLAALNLLDRAQRLRPDGGLDVSLEMARHEELLSCGRLEEAAERMTVVVERAKARGDTVGALRAELARLRTRLAMHPGRLEAELQALVDRARPVLEAAGDPAALATLWQAAGLVANYGARNGDSVAATREALRYATLAEDLPLQERIRSRLARMVTWAPIPIAEALALLEELSAEAQTVDFEALNGRSALLAFRGQVDEARALHEEVVRGLLDRGLTVSAAYTGQAGWYIEVAAGDMAAAERVVRATYAQLETTGERSYMSTQACYIAESAYQAGRFDEAQEWAQRGRDLADQGDLVTHILGALVQSKALAAKGFHEEAQQLAEQGLAHTAGVQAPILLGHALVWHAEVLHLGGRFETATEQLARGLEHLGARGCTALVDQARRHANEIGLAT
jgi:class 3 adenylate cyclase/tetratricopeptide (TPR) repeat protein